MSPPSCKLSSHRIILLSHAPSYSDNAIANAGNHPYCEIFVVRDELTALKFLSDKLRDDEVLRADF